MRPKSRRAILKRSCGNPYEGGPLVLAAACFRVASAAAVQVERAPSLRLRFQPSPRRTISSGTFQFGIADWSRQRRPLCSPMSSIRRTRKMSSRKAFQESMFRWEPRGASSGPP